jgi:hypothetical protein
MAGRAHAYGYRTAQTVFGPFLGDVRLVAVADLNGKVAADTARRYGFERAETSWQAIAEAPDIDVVSVVVANPLHREILLPESTVRSYVCWPSCSCSCSSCRHDRHRLLAGHRGNLPHSPARIRSPR